MTSDVDHDVGYNASSNMTSPPFNATASDDDEDLVTSLWRHPVPAGSWWPEAVWLLPPVGLFSTLLNAVTLCALVTERALQTTLYTYLASLCVSDVIGAIVVVVISRLLLTRGVTSERSPTVVLSEKEKPLLGNDYDEYYIMV